MSRLSSILSCWPVILITALSAGCIRLEKPYPQKNTYVLSAPRPAGPGNREERALPDGVLLVRNFTSSSLFQGKGFVHRVGELEYRTDFYHEFFASPAGLITEESTAWLQQADLFGYVMEGGELSPTHILRGRIDALYGDFRPNHAAKAVLEMQLTLIDDHMATAEILLARQYRREIPLTGRSPDALLQGWNAALVEILTEFEADARKAILPTAPAEPVPSAPLPDQSRAPPPEEISTSAPRPHGGSSLFPDGQLFEAALANPKEPRFHVTWLKLDIDSGPIDVASVGFGESFGLIRWHGPGRNGEWQFGISGAVFAQFNLDSDSTDLINADYIIGLPLSYRNGSWSARARLYHQSSHLGDEFLLFPQDIGPVERINLSFETLELLGAWQWRGLRITGGPSYILHTDTPLDRPSVQLSADYHGPKIPYVPGNLFGSLFLHWWEETDWETNLNLKAGINLESPYSGKHSLQFFAEYFTGHLPFGQFYQEVADYYGIGLSLGL